jgi:hypothetical protein
MSAFLCEEEEEVNEEEAKKRLPHPPLLALVHLKAHEHVYNKYTFNSYQHGERGDRFIDGFLFHSIRRRAILVVGRRHHLSLLHSLSSQRVFFVKSSLRSY